LKIENFDCVAQYKFMNPRCKPAASPE